MEDEMRAAGRRSVLIDQIQYLEIQVDGTEGQKRSQHILSSVHFYVD